MRLKAFLITAACLMAMPAAASAQDQPWLKDRRYTEGIGYRVGDLELHPGIAGEFGYDSNYLHRDDDSGSDASLRLRITPSFSLSTLGKQRREQGAPPPDLEFRAGVAATYNEFFPVSGDAATRSLMHDQRNVGGNLGLQLTVFPQNVWSFGLHGNLARSLTPADSGQTTSSFNRVLANVGGELIWTPGAGLFDWRLGYDFSGTIFEESDLGGLTNMEHTVSTRGRWRFLPRTALLYSAKLGFINYPNPDGQNGKTGSHPLRALMGINGLVTNSFAVLALAGWGATFYTPRGQEDFDSLLAQAEVKWYLTPNPSSDPAAATLSLSSIAVGFLRDFYDSYIGTYYERDRGYLNLSYFFGGKFLVVTEGGVAAIVYPPSVQLPNPSTDIRVDASIFGEYRFKDSIGVNTTIRYGTNISDNALVTTTGTGAAANTSRDSLQWQQFEAYLGARWFM